MSPSRSPWIDDELAMLQEHVARFLKREFTPHAERWRRERQVDRSAWVKAAEAGLLCASIPEAYGGGGGTLSHESVIHQEVTRLGLAGGSGGGNRDSSGTRP